MDEIKWPRLSAWGQVERRSAETKVGTLKESALEMENQALRIEARDLLEELDRTKAELEELREDYEDHISRCAGEREE